MRPARDRREERQRVLAYIGQHPGQPTWQIAQALELNPRAVGGYVANAQYQGLACCERDMNMPNSEGRTTYGTNVWHLT